MSDIRKDLKSSAGDVVHTSVTAALSAIPFVGGSASVLFSSLIAPPISKRRDEWLIQLAQGLEEVRTIKPEFDIESLQSNEVFITTILHATQAVIKNHQTEKLTALKNAVLNSAVGIDIDESIQLMFLNLIDTITPWHINILQFFNNPRQWCNERGFDLEESPGSQSELIEYAFPELRGKRTFYDQILKDLTSQGLFGINNPNIIMSESGKQSQRTTTFGNQFLAYISAPLS